MLTKPFRQEVGLYEKNKLVSAGHLSDETAGWEERRWRSLGDTGFGYRGSVIGRGWRMSEHKLSFVTVMILAAQPGLRMQIFPRRSFKQMEHGKLGDSEQAEPRILAGLTADGARVLPRTLTSASALVTGCIRPRTRDDKSWIARK